MILKLLYKLVRSSTEIAETLVIIEDIKHRIKRYVKFLVIK